MEKARIPRHIFLCHSSNDKPTVRILYNDLQRDGFFPWLDEEDLIPGQEWDVSIKAAVRSSVAVVVCLSGSSTTKEGYVQKEIRLALDVADEKPEGTIFLIPLRLEDCDVPSRISRWQWVDLFEPGGYDKLLVALRSRITAVQYNTETGKLSRELIRTNETVEPRGPELGDNEKSLLIAAASDRNGQVMTGSTMEGFFVQANNTSFVDGSPRSEASWKRVVKRLSALVYLEPTSRGIYKVTDDGFARADREIAAAPLEISLSFVGTPDKQMLSVVTNKSITPKKLDFLMSSEAYITSTDLDEATAGSTIVIPLDLQKITELFNAPRPDKNYSDHAGPAALRLVLMSNGRRCEVVLPILLQPVFISNTLWIKMSGSKTFTLT